MELTQGKIDSIEQKIKDGKYLSSSKQISTPSENENISKSELEKLRQQIELVNASLIYGENIKAKLNESETALAAYTQRSISDRLYIDTLRNANERLEKILSEKDKLIGKLDTEKGQLEVELAKANKHAEEIAAGKFKDARKDLQDKIEELTEKLNKKQEKTAIDWDSLIKCANNIKDERYREIISSYLSDLLLAGDFDSETYMSLSKQANNIRKPSPSQPRNIQVIGDYVEHKIVEKQIDHA